jgi:hypothetical protein
MLETKTPREQSGRDSLSRFRAQVRSAAMASLSILEGQEIDRVYCDLHDDFVVRKNHGSNFSYVFYQVKTQGKQNHNWTLNEVFGLKSSIRNQSKQNTDDIKSSFVGKLLMHTVVFDTCCNSVVFQTNINNDDDIEKLLDDIDKGTFSNHFVNVLIERFNSLFPEKISKELTHEEIKEKLSKLRFETDVQYLKNGDHNFEPLARDQIYAFSEVDLDFYETKEILMKLLELVERKSSEIITELTSESIEKYAGISINDLLSILSISKDAYTCLMDGGDSKAIKSASIIQRTLQSSGAGTQTVVYCSKCKVDWDNWLRMNRHMLLVLDINIIICKISTLLTKLQVNGNSVKLSALKQPITDLIEELKTEGILYDLNEDLVLGAIFSELVRGKS